MDGEADDLLAVVFRWFPREQDRSARQRRGLEPERGTGNARPYDDRQLCSSAGGSQAVRGQTLVVAGVIWAQLVDEEDAGALRFYPGVQSQALPVLQPEQRRGRRGLAATHEPRRVPAG